MAIVGERKTKKMRTIKTKAINYIVLYAKEQITSVLAQTYSLFSVIVPR